ncbi:MAG: sodium:solute symporter, partial [Luteolibacter sp.]
MLNRLKIFQTHVATLWLLTLFSVRADISWSDLPPLPDPLGFAGSFAGTCNDTLLVAGGANFPDGPPWDDGSKIWHDRVFALEQGAGEWREAGKLPRPLGYGVSISTPDGVICIGGSDERAHYSEVFRLKYNGAKVEIENLPPLPVKLANMAGALVEGSIHVIG